MKKMKEIRVFDLYGREIKPETARTGINKFTLDVSSFSSGLYLVLVKTSERVYSGKVSVVK